MGNPRGLFEFLKDSKCGNSVHNCFHLFGLVVGQDLENWSGNLKMVWAEHKLQYFQSNFVSFNAEHDSIFRRDFLDHGTHDKSWIHKVRLHDHQDHLYCALLRRVYLPFVFDQHLHWSWRILPHQMRFNPSVFLRHFPLTSRLSTATNAAKAKEMVHARISWATPSRWSMDFLPQSPPNSNV